MKAKIQASYLGEEWINARDARDAFDVSTGVIR